MIITTTTDLRDLCQELAKAPFITLDTEFIREKTYYPELCLIQIAGPDRAACIDPLAPDLDLHPLFELLQNPDVVKVFHAARQDVEIFYHLTGQVPTPLFDTQLAAMVCGYSHLVGYQQLVQDITGVSLDKSMRVTDWSRRPLTEAQVEYALHDVTHLRDVYLALDHQLKENNRLGWLAEEIAVQNDPTTYDSDDDTVWQRIRIPFKRPLQTHVFARLCAWRERKAKTLNRPRKFIVKDEALIELAATMPKTAAEMDSCRNLSKGFGKSAFGKEMLSVIEAALNDPADTHPKDWTKPKSLTATQHTLVDLYHLLLDMICDNLNVAPRIIASTEELHELARGNNDVPCMKGWRREVFGERLILFKQGRIVFAYNPKTHRPEIIDRPPKRVSKEETND